MVSVSVTPALQTVENLIFWIIAQYNKQNKVKINVDEEFVIVSKDRKIWKSTESAAKIDINLFKSINGVP